MRLVWVVLLVAGLVAVLVLHGAPRAVGNRAPVYLALGDSLAASIQKGRTTSEGYAEAIVDARAEAFPGLKLAKLGRGGETASSMLASTASRRSQLEQAANLLQSGRVVFVTIDVGANEVESCQKGDGFDAACVRRGLASLRTSLPEIIRGLRAAGGSTVPIVGMNYYNSFLGRWVTGARGRRLALASVPVERQIDRTLATIYRRAGVPMADVAGRFATSSFRSVNTREYGRVPLAVARTCEWTWACVPPYDDHTNTAGYQVIARALLALVPSD
ncbi:MAG TPA: GDSL-type esterase/lipase family protein [Thermoleophilaceae bacterium]|jgi:lysophospholipase L1-like esterase|nr:GDSL-type esterase/lipase family protein [Thermoleophilaceae bacterium]